MRLQWLNRRPSWLSSYYVRFIVSLKIKKLRQKGLERGFDGIPALIYARPMIAYEIKQFMEALILS